MEKEEIETWIKNVKAALPFLEEKFALLSLTLNLNFFPKKKTLGIFFP